MAWYGFALSPTLAPKRSINVTTLAGAAEERDIAPFVIRLLGSPEFAVGQRSLSFPTRKTVALLVYLVVQGGRPSRETLMALLWPESPPEKAAATLRGTLSRLRKALLPAGSYLLVEGSTVAFDFDQAHDLDLSRLAAASLEETPPAEMTAIVALDRGDFLEGFSLADAPAFDTWAAIQREACQRQLEAVYDRLSQYQLATHNSGAAVETAARWVARAPLAEQAYRRLMAAQALSGQRPAAMQTYRQLRTTLRNELDLEPARESSVLAASISRGQVGQELAARPAVTPVTTRELRLALPLVGRAEEHGQLVASFQQIGKAGTQVVALIGAAGVGKTRLVGAFLNWAMMDAPEVEIWQGRAFESGGRLAYQPVVEALRLRLERVNAPEDLLDDVWLAELSQLMPELRARYPDLPPPMVGDAHFIRARLFEALAILGSALAARRPAVFLLDDIQWAQTDTLDLVHYLSRRWAELGAPILLLLAIRQEDYAADRALREWLARLERDGTVTRLLLDSLSGAAVRQLVERLAGAEVAETVTSEFASWLWAETRGLPFFIEALLQMLVEQGIVTSTGEARPAYDFAPALKHVRATARVPLPPGVREVILARLARHSEAAGALLLAAAVLARPSTFDLLRQVADLAETPALTALETLLDGRLLVERPGALRPFMPAHDYIRQVVYTESHEVRRRVFHRRALLALEATAAPAAECAFHAVAALLDEPAFRFSLAAGHEASASYAAQEALAHFETARDIARRMEAGGEPVSSEALRQLYSERGRVLELIQDDAAAQENYEEMRAVAVQRGDRAMELAAFIVQSNLNGTYTGVFNPPKARELAQAALALARELGDRTAEAGALWGLQVAEFFGAGDSNLVLAYGQQSLALARELGLKEQMGLVLTNLCWPYVAQRRLDSARQVLDEGQAIWRELDNRPKLAEAAGMMLFIHSFAGDHQRMLADAPQVAELSASIGSRLNQSNAIRWLAVVHARQGRFEQALAYLEQAEALSEASASLYSQRADISTRITSSLLAGALEEADQWADKLYAQREAMAPVFIETYLTHVAWAKIACGKLDMGQAILDELVVALPADAPRSHNIIGIAVGYGHLRLAQDRPEDLFAGLEERVRPYREAGFDNLLADELWLHGRALLALGRFEAARTALLNARAAAEKQGERAMLWRILVTLSEAEIALGNISSAGRLRQQAQAVVDDIAAHAGSLRDAFMDQPALAQLLGLS
jgi:DNA-binding SARP family transcriptional activator